MSIEFESIELWMLVFVRIAGMVLLNPLLSRRNVPSQVRMGLVVCLTLLIAPTLPPPTVPMDTDTISVAVAMIKEIFVGMLCGYVFQTFYMMLFFVGDLLDVEFGMAMAKVFDPSTNIQMSITGNWLNIMFMMYLFATGSHLVLIHLFASSFQLLPVGTIIFSPEASKFAIDLFIQVFMLTFKLIIPFIVAELVLQVGMGILMKLVSQIHIFVINFQIKLMLGLGLFFLCVPIISSFLDRYIVLLLENIQRGITLLAG